MFTLLLLNEQDLQDELEDLTEQSNEIQEVMGRSYGMPEVDDDELEAELDALGDEIALDDDTSYLDEAVRAPNAPTTVPGADSVAARVCIISHDVPPYLVL